MRPACIVCGCPEDIHDPINRHAFVPTPKDAEAAIRRVAAEIDDWPAADLWHRDAIIKAIGGCTCGEAWRGHPNPHALTCPMHVNGCTCGGAFNPQCPEHGGNEHRP